jgi:hypothetical protein
MGTGADAGSSAWESGNLYNKTMARNKPAGVFLSVKNFPHRPGPLAHLVVQHFTHPTFLPQEENKNAQRHSSDRTHKHRGAES